MAKYSDIKGFTVQTVSTDPAASAAASGSWASGGDMNTTHAYAGAAGTQTAGLVFAGVTPAQTANTESYNGTSWTEVNNMNQAAGYIESAGVTNTAALAIGGHRPSNPTAFTEQWDGTNWTEVGDLNTPRSFGGSSGSSTSALIYGGLDPSYPPQTAKTESWNGSSWTEVSDLNTNREVNAGLGVNNSNALSVGGSPGPTTVESWNGSSWTEVSEINTGRNAGAGFGAYDDGIFCGGGPGGLANTEAWNGSAWSEVADLANARTALKSGYGCPSGVGIAFGGTSPPSSTYRAFTEEWTTSFTPTTLKKITEGQLFFNSTANAFKETITDIPAATWASAPSMNTPAPANYSRAQFGSGTSSNVAAGSNPNGTLCESFDGTSWTEFTEKSGGNTEKPGLGQSGTAGFVIGQDSNTGYVEEWNGSSWSEKADLNTGRNASSAGGTVTSGLVFGGETPQYDETESWNGSAWTEVADLNTGKAKAAGWGASNIDAISAVGFAPIHSPTYRKNTELWDGTSWTEVADTNDFHQSGGCSGFISTLGIVFAGDAQQPPGAGRTTKTELWNGTSWTEINDTSVAAMDSGFGPSGKASSAMFITGDTSSGRVNSTEMFDASLANKTITAS